MNQSVNSIKSMQIFTRFISGIWRRSLWLTAGCVLLASQLAPASAPQAVDEVTVWAAPDMQKIRPDDEVESENIVWSADEGRITVAGAGNEHVPFQVVITTPVPEGYEPEAPGGFFIESSELTSGDGRIIARDQIDFYLEHYVHLYAKSSPIGDTGYWPDALAPIREPFSMEAEYSVVRNRPIWVDLQIPSETPAGTYTGTITVTHHGETLETLDLQVKVYDFSLPDQTHLITYINTSRGRLANFYNLSSSSEEIQQLTQIYYEELYANRMEPWFNDPLEPEVSVRGENVEVEFDEERYDYYINELNSNRVLLEALPHDLEEAIEAEEFSAPFNQRVRSYLSQVEAFFEEHGWEDRLVINSPIDEPNTAEEYERTRQWGQLVHEATDGVPFLATETPVADDPDWGTLRNDVDNFSVHGNSLNSPEVKAAIVEEQAGGGEITWYISCDQGYPQPNYFIDAPAMDPVMVPWITARYGMDGILYWATTHWADTPNPWRDAGSFNSGYFCSGGYVLNGEGYLFYPGDSTEEFTGQPDVEGPVTSIRFELLREGIEDYEYLWMLRSHGAEEFAREQVRNMVVDVSAFSRNAEELYRTREAMAERLEQLTE
jgi:hypothetical protein